MLAIPSLSISTTRLSIEHKQLCLESFPDQLFLKDSKYLMHFSKLCTKKRRRKNKKARLRQALKKKINPRQKTLKVKKRVIAPRAVQLSFSLWRQLVGNDIISVLVTTIMSIICTRSRHDHIHEPG